MAAWILDRNKVMTKDEVVFVLQSLARRARRSENTAINDVVFRLAISCGLRAAEIASLRMCDVKLGDGSRPYIHVHKGKGGKTADVTIPDTGTVAVFQRHLTSRKETGAKGRELFVIKTNGKGFNRQEIAKRFKSAIRCLSAERISDLSVHSGRHTAATMLLDDGHSLATVRDFMRHSNISVTSVYLHGREIEPVDMFPAQNEPEFSVS